MGNLQLLGKFLIASYSREKLKMKAASEVFCKMVFCKAKTNYKNKKNPTDIIFSEVASFESGSFCK